MNICLLTRSLTRGGAQVQVSALGVGLQSLGHGVSVATFYGGGALESQIEAAHVPVIRLEKSSRADVINPTRRLVQHLRVSKCDVAYSFLPLENLLGLAAARMSRTPIVWGLRGAAVKRDQYGLASRLLYGAQFRLLGCPDAVISNSDAALLEQKIAGQHRVYVVPNGIDCSRYVPHAELRSSFRDTHRLERQTPVVGIVARFDPMKDHRTFLRAAQLVRERIGSVRIVIAGDGPDAYRDDLERLAVELGINDHVLWLGEVQDVAAVYNALDVLVSASAYGEGFSNVVGEGMACGTSVVVTDVGDSARIVADLGRVVPAREPVALGEAIIAALTSDSEELRVRRRKRIVEEFGVDAMVSRTEAILRHVVENR